MKNQISQTQGYVPSKEIVNTVIDLLVKHRSLRLITINSTRKDFSREKETKSLADLVDGTIKRLASKSIQANHRAYESPYLLCDSQGKFPVEIEDWLKMGLIMELRQGILPALGKDIVNYVKKRRTVEKKNVYTLLYDNNGVSYKISPKFKPDEFPKIR